MRSLSLGYFLGPTTNVAQSREFPWWRSDKGDHIKIKRQDTTLTVNVGKYARPNLLDFHKQVKKKAQDGKFHRLSNKLRGTSPVLRLRRPGVASRDLTYAWRLRQAS